MKFIPIHKGEVKDCKLLIADKEKWWARLMSMNGKKVRVTVVDDIDARSNQQNRFYWMYLTLIESETGNNADDLHEYFKRRFLPPRFVTIFNKEIKLPATTTQLDKIAFINYLDKICAESGVPIPDINEIV